jgi:ArsR family transcriptional regulator, arsenate/arsenite/antimonite-responsive transcriptional repressor / arsenate reductase (thioredoxin)
VKTGPAPGIAFSDRVARHAALGDVVRLAIIDALVLTDRSPQELQRIVDAPSNLLAHHLDVLSAAGLIERHQSNGDGRRRYVRLRVEALHELGGRPKLRAQPALFICTANSARSQLAAELWRHIVHEEARSAGTHPAPAVHPGAVRAATRAGLDLARAAPVELPDLETLPPLVITVCDRAHEELTPADTWLHWSIADPVTANTNAAFDATIVELRRRIDDAICAA